MRRFMRGEDVEEIALSFLGPDAREDYCTVMAKRLTVESAIRRHMLRTEKRYTMKTKALRHKIETMKEEYR